MREGGPRIGRFSAPSHASDERRLGLLQRLRSPDFESQLSCAFQPQWALGPNHLPASKRLSGGIVRTSEPSRPPNSCRSPKTTRASMRIRPAIGGWRPSSVFNSVDLPDPFTPRRAVKLARAMESEIPESTGWLL